MTTINVSAILAISMMKNKNNAKNARVLNVPHFIIVQNVLTICSLQIVPVINN